MSKPEGFAALKPCPFCGGPAKATPDGAGWPLIVCTPCGAYVEAVNAADDPVPRWNHRPDRDATIEECAKVVEAQIGKYERDGWAHAALESAAFHLRALRRAGEPT